MKRRVAKVGGSLLDTEEFDRKINTWLAQHGDMQNVIVVGGGKIVDCLRTFARANCLSEPQAHEIACRAMDLTATMVAYALGDTDRCDDVESLLKLESANVVFHSSEWILRQNDIPASWDFTSDSIAARLADKIDAEELVLLKSRMGSIDEPGFVDACFATESQSVRSIRVCTLKE